MIQPNTILPQPMPSPPSLNGAKHVVISILIGLLTLFFYFTFLCLI